MKIDTFGLQNAGAARNNLEYACPETSDNPGFVVDDLRHAHVRLYFLSGLAAMRRDYSASNTGLSRK